MRRVRARRTTRGRAPPDARALRSRRRPRELVAAGPRLTRDVRPVLRIDQDARELLRRTLLDRALEPFPDQCLGAWHELHVPDHLLERPSMVEREDVETFVVSELIQPD